MSHCHYSCGLHLATSLLSYHHGFHQHTRPFTTHHCCSQLGTYFTHPTISCCRPDGSKDFRGEKRAHHSETQQAQVEENVLLSATSTIKSASKGLLSLPE